MSILWEQEDVSRLTANTYPDEMEQEVFTDSPKSHPDEVEQEISMSSPASENAKFTTRKTIP
jgi:hypothetical protein